MYQNSIRRITPNSHPQFLIRRSEIAFDERLPFIESVLETLLESRFGPGGVYQSVLRSSDHPEVEPAVSYDFDRSDSNDLVPFYALPSLGRAGYQAVEAVYRRAKQMGLFAAPVSGFQLTADCSSNLGRGSSRTNKHQRCVVI